MKKPSVVVDTNIFISGLILPNSKAAFLLSALRRKRYTLVTSEPLLEELRLVLARPAYEARYHITAATRRQLLAYLEHQARIVRRLKKPTIAIRDPKDLVVLATALDGKADVLVTGDKDLLVLKDSVLSHGLAIKTLDEFVTLLKLSSTKA